MVIVITGLILAGKSTLAKHLMGWGYKPVTEYTTRPMREGERDNKDYHFVDDGRFDEMVRKKEFAETFYVDTVHGLWKYGAKKEDLKDGYILVCGPDQARQMLDSDVDVLSVLLDIDWETALRRAKIRGDDFEELNRRFHKDEKAVDKIRERVDMVLNAEDPVEENARAIDRERVKRTGRGYMRSVDGQPVVTAQEMDKAELNMYLSGDRGLVPYLRMKDKGMPQNPVNQIAWLLLQGGGCGFCKVCRKEPCNIKDGEICTANIADYIRGCVHAEDARKGQENE